MRHEINKNLQIIYTYYMASYNNYKSTLYNVLHLSMYDVNVPYSNIIIIL